MKLTGVGAFIARRLPQAAWRSPMNARLPLSLAALALVTPTLAHAQEFVAIPLANVRIVNGINTTRTSAPATLEPAPRYRSEFSADTLVRGDGGLLGILYPTAIPFTQFLESVAPGSSEQLSGEVANPCVCHPAAVSNQPFSATGVISGIEVTVSFTLSSGIQADNTASFSITNVSITPTIVGGLRFTQGSILITRVCIADWDRNGEVEPVDVRAFFEAFRNGNADANGDGETDPLDIRFFFDRSRAGC
jgi:hypothetical protein